jgi:hypothetical protein
MTTITYDNFLSGTPVEQSGNTIYAGPVSGIAKPAFRALTAADLPQAPGFSVHKNGTDQTGIAPNTNTKVTWSTESHDIGSQFASSRFTVSIPGTYLFTIQLLYYYALPSGTQILLRLYKNGTPVRDVRTYIIVTNASHELATVLLEQTGDGDYYEVYTQHAGTTDTGVYGGSGNTYWAAQWLGN